MRLGSGSDDIGDILMSIKLCASMDDEKQARNMIDLDLALSNMELSSHM